MDKSWIKLTQRTSKEYKKGVKRFLNFAFANKRRGSEIKCPCTSCRNSINHRKQDVYEHAIMYGFLESYTNWIYHGETPNYLHNYEVENDISAENQGDDLHGMLHEVFHIETQNQESNNDEMHRHMEGLNEEADKFFQLLKSAECELYPGCKSFTFLAFIVRILHVKTLCRWSNTSFTMLLEVLKQAFPENESFPSSYREAWKIVKDLGLDYKKIHACPNDCMLYTKEMEKEVECKHCHASRYKQFENEVGDESSKKRKVPAKVVRYFPFKPRLQRLFMSSKTSSLMRWHAEKRVDDGIQRHPADSLAWKTFDEKYPLFASDCRNVRLGLASDGFNPFKTMNVAHSTWPVVLVPYNLPPDMCMKQTSFMLSLLIDGPRGPGNKIDVYLQLLIDELKELWESGVQTYDIVSNQMFSMRAALLWTISDFPGYAMLSGWSTKGALACPCCNKDTRSCWLKHSRKFCYTGHRRFLDIEHNFRKDRVLFDGTMEYGVKPGRLTGVEILEQQNGLRAESEMGESSKSKKRKKLEDQGPNSDSPERHNWKKKSVFFQLPYWSENLNPHNLDIMHIEKNNSENLFGTLLSITGKTKDNLKARNDLKLMRIRKALHPQERGGKKVYLPPACFTMSKEDKSRFLKVLKSVKVPDGYASNISRHVNLKDQSISGLKSHDNHILIQQLIPIAIRRSLPKNVSKPLIELGNCFRQLYSKGNCLRDLEALQDRMALTLCHLEKIFPPSFFDIMEHLPIHLPEESIIGGPVQFRSMYPIERYLCTLKNYVRTRSHPEGSIAEGYLAEECMTFCSRYLEDVESKVNRPPRNFDRGDSINEGFGRAYGKGKLVLLDDVSWVQAHRYVLFNCDIVEPFRKKHIKHLRKERRRASEFERDKMHNEQFHKWFKYHVQNLELTNGQEAIQIPSDVKLLAAGPNKWARSYSGFIVNGFRFHTKKREMRRKTQNSGVYLSARVDSFSSRKDKNPILGSVNFYGVLTEIIELRYSNDLKFVLFKCDWVDNNSGKREDDLGFTLVNFNHLLYRHNRVADEPFILSSQAQQVLYVQDPVDLDWHVAVIMKPRNSFILESDDLTEPQLEPFTRQQLDDVTYNHADEVTWVRSEVDGVIVDKPEGDNPEETNEDLIESSEDEVSDNSVEESEEDDFFSDDNSQDIKNDELESEDD